MELAAVAIGSIVLAALLGAWTRNSIAARRGRAPIRARPALDATFALAFALVGMLIAAAAVVDPDGDPLERWLQVVVGVGLAVGNTAVVLLRGRLRADVRR